MTTGTAGAAPAHDRRPPRRPRLASDIARGYLALVPTTVLVFAVGFVIGATGLVGAAELASSVIEFYLLFWVVYAVSSIMITLRVFGRATPHELRDWLAATAPPANRVLHVLWAATGGGAVSWAVTGAFFSALGIVLLAASDGGLASVFTIVVSVASIAASWAVTAVAYAVRLAREDAVNGGARFPGEHPPVFADWIYLAVQLNTTFSTSDVEITTPGLRRVVTTGSVLAFTFNTVIVALLVSVLITLLA
jgi:uncharacterized membrane protein